MNIYRWKHANYKQHLLGLVQGFAELLDGIITIISLGFFASNFEMTIAKYRALYFIKGLKHGRKN